MDTLDQINAAFDGKLVGTRKMKDAVLTTLARLPRQVVNHITQNCWVVGSMEDAWAFTFTGNDLTNQHLIFLSDELFDELEEQIAYTIAHEIGHIMLEHRNSVFERQTPEEIAMQEKQADAFVATYLK